MSKPVTFVLVPGASIGDLRLGQAREQVRARFDEAPRVFPDPKRKPADYFTQSQVQVYYAADGAVERILVFEPNAVTLGAVQLMGLKRPAVLDTLRKAGMAPADIVDFLFDADAGFGVQLQRDRVWTVEVFAPGYHAELEEMLRQS